MSRFLSIRDMIDGGGAGASGSEFKGGALSGILNALGVKPAGHRDRAGNMGQAAPQRPSRVVSAAPVAPATANPAASVDPRVNATWDRQRGMTDPVVAPPVYSGRGVFGMPAGPALVGAGPQQPTMDAAYQPTTMVPPSSYESPAYIPAGHPDPAITHRSPTTAGPNVYSGSGVAGNKFMSDTYSSLLAQGKSPAEAMRIMKQYLGYGAPGAR